MKLFCGTFLSRSTVTSFHEKHDAVEKIKDLYGSYFSSF
jgi:hypothetical protein